MPPRLLAPFRKPRPEDKIGSGDGIRFDVDAPGEGTLASGPTMLAGGWVADDRGIPLAIDVRINGVRVARATTFHPRPDVQEGLAHELAEGTEVIGWNAQVPLDLVAPGACEVDVVAFRADRTRTGVGRSRIEIADVEGASPASGKFVMPPMVGPGFRRIIGSVRSDAPVARVQVRIDGVDAGLARIALPDDGDPLDDIRALSSGFELAWRFEANTTVTLEATVVDIEGGSFELPAFQVQVDDEPTWDSETARVAKLQARTAQRVRELVGPSALSGREPLRCLVFTHDLGLGGGQLYLQELLLRLAHKGVWCAVVSPREGVLRGQLEDLGFEVHVSGPTPFDDEDAYEGRIAELVSWAGPLDCNVAIANTMMTFPGVDAATRLGLPVSWAIHESFDLEQFWMEALPPDHVHPYVAGRARHALAHTAHAIFEADATRQQYAPLLAEGAGMVVPYGVDFDAIDAYMEANPKDEVRAALGIAPDERVLLCMGTVEPRKAQLMLVSAFERVRADRCTLVLVGARPGPYTAAIERLVREQGMQDRVRIEPIVKDTYRWYRVADVLVCASDVESLPRSILEAMGFGLAIVSTAVFGIPELVEDGATGLLCEPRDLGALRDRLQDVADLSVDELRAIAAAGSRHVRERHAPQIYADVYESLLEAGAAEREPAHR